MKMFLPSLLQSGPIVYKTAKATYEAANKAVKHVAKHGVPNSIKQMLNMQFDYVHSTRFGGKPYPLWENAKMELPGYKNAYFVFHNTKTGENVTAAFMVSPSGFSEQRSSSNQISKTNTGWFVQRGGKSLINITLSGYMLDTRNVTERLRFIAKYKDYAEEQRTRATELISDWTQVLYVEGIKYEGILQAINLSKNGNQPFLYQYNLSFISYNDTIVYNTEKGDNIIAKSALNVMDGKRSDNTDGENKAINDNSIQITDGLYTLLTMGGQK